MSNDTYDPKLSQAGFMDLLVALQAQLKTADSIKTLAGMPHVQREAAIQLGVEAKRYVDLVEGATRLAKNSGGKHMTTLDPTAAQMNNQQMLDRVNVLSTEIDANEDENRDMQAEIDRLYSQIDATRLA